MPACSPFAARYVHSAPKEDPKVTGTTRPGTLASFSMIVGTLLSVVLESTPMTQKSMLIALVSRR